MTTLPRPATRLHERTRQVYTDSVSPPSASTGIAGRTESGGDGRRTACGKQAGQRSRRAASWVSVCGARPGRRARVRLPRRPHRMAMQRQSWVWSGARSGLPALLPLDPTVLHCSQFDAPTALRDPYSNVSGVPLDALCAHRDVSSRAPACSAGPMVRYLVRRHRARARVGRGAGCQSLPRSAFCARPTAFRRYPRLPGVPN